MTLPLANRDLTQLPLLHDTHKLRPEFLRLRCAGTDARKQRNLHFSQTSLSIGAALVSRFLVVRDLEMGRLVQVVDGILEGHDDFYLLARHAGERQATVDTVRQWLLSQSDP